MQQAKLRPTLLQPIWMPNRSAPTWSPRRTGPEQNTGPMSALLSSLQREMDASPP